MIRKITTPSDLLAYTNPDAPWCISSTHVPTKSNHPIAVRAVLIVFVLAAVDGERVCPICFGSIQDLATREGYQREE
jgi:hypothetical protein